MSNTLDQFYVFLGAVYGGIIIGIWYDVLRLFRILTQSKTWLVAICDILFWFGAAILYFEVMFGLDNAQIRFYPILGCVVGFVLYLLGPSRIVMRGFSPIARSAGDCMRRAAAGMKRKRAEKKALRRLQRETAREEDGGGEISHGGDKDPKAE